MSLLQANWLSPFPECEFESRTGLEFAGFSIYAIFCGLSFGAGFLFVSDLVFFVLYLFSFLLCSLACVLCHCCLFS